MQRSTYVAGVPSPSEPLRDYVMKQQTKQFKTCVPADGLRVSAHQNLESPAAKSGAGDGTANVKRQLQQQITSSAYSVGQEKVEQLKEEIENIWAYLDHLSHKLELCSLSQTTLADDSKTARVASPKCDSRQVATIRFDNSSGIRSSKNYDESVYFGFANDERIAKSRPQQFYDCGLPMKIAAQKVHAAQSVHSDVCLSAPNVVEKESDAPVEEGVQAKAEKSHKSVDASVYHAKELFNHYYA